MTEKLCLQAAAMVAVVKTVLALHKGAKPSDKDDRRPSRLTFGVIVMAGSVENTDCDKLQAHLHAAHM